MATLFQARYKGLCLPCGEDIHKGEWLTTHPEYGYIHEECTDVEPAQSQGESRSARSPIPSVLPRGKTAKDRCDDCFMVHSDGQDGCE